MSLSRQTEILEHALAPLILLSTDTKPTIGVSKPSVNASTKKIQLTIGGGSAGTGKIVNVSVLWRPLVSGGYYLNA